MRMEKLKFENSRPWLKIGKDGCQGDEVTRQCAAIEDDMIEIV